jgi:hypothetical protein
MEGSSELKKIAVLRKVSESNRKQQEGVGCRGSRVLGGFLK